MSDWTGTSDGRRRRSPCRSVIFRPLLLYVSPFHFLSFPSLSLPRTLLATESTHLSIRSVSVTTPESPSSADVPPRIPTPLPSPSIRTKRSPHPLLPTNQPNQTALLARPLVLAHPCTRPHSTAATYGYGTVTVRRALRRVSVVRRASCCVGWDACTQGSAHCSVGVRRCMSCKKDQLGKSLYCTLLLHGCLGMYIQYADTNTWAQVGVYVAKKAPGLASGTPRDAVVGKKKYHR